MIWEIGHTLSFGFLNVWHFGWDVCMPSVGYRISGRRQGIQKPIAEKALMLLETFSRYAEHCHELASTERVWPRAFAVLLV